VKQGSAAEANLKIGHLQSKQSLPSHHHSNTDSNESFEVIVYGISFKQNDKVRLFIHVFVVTVDSLIHSTNSLSILILAKFEVDSHRLSLDRVTRRRSKSRLRVKILIAFELVSIMV
jgi:hypothetical protein